ncbi:hypothetical protein FDP41_002582 [Naegleria fowleri]|uniref:Uncharacterized protein n=1 Tax=Naegleria fowleri TaxID=5763 RepID=A0A6A5BM12_NAEFO|nr:uncharacterized protein FDP41_002582 [Naegleria fowleri]KAF0978067.1 hypothetical protein FDP41_002582 [Naegleria fowleri]CAG4710804.1 unnamed protein product [Naegleria fowleri]
MKLSNIILAVLLLSTLLFMSVNYGKADSMNKYIPPPPPPKPTCPPPKPSPSPPVGIPPPTPTPSIDVYVPTSANCANAFATITSYTFQISVLSQYRQCRALLVCLNRWIELLLQLVLAGLTPGATFSNTLSPVVLELNNAFGYVNTNLGGILSESGTTVQPRPTQPSACTLIFAPVLAADGNVYASECVAFNANAPNPYVSVTVNSGSSSSGLTLADVTNPRVALTTLYAKYVVKILGFIQTYLNECELSTETRVYSNGLTSMNNALASIASGDFNTAKNQVIEFSRNV